MANQDEIFENKTQKENYNFSQCLDVLGRGLHSKEKKFKLDLRSNQLDLKSTRLNLVDLVKFEVEIEFDPKGFEDKLFGF